MVSMRLPKFLGKKNIIRDKKNSSDSSSADLAAAEPTKTSAITKPVPKQDGGESFYETVTFNALPDEYLQRYQIQEAIVTITADFQYLVWEPQFLTPEDKATYDSIMNYKHLLQEANTDATLESLMETVAKAADDLGHSDVLKKNYKTFEYYIKRDILGHGILDVMMNDSEHLEDITCSDYESVGVMHRDYLESEILRSNVRFKNPEHMKVYLERLARQGSKHISSSDPIIDFHLGEKYRIAIISDEVTSTESHSLSIRLKSEKPFTITEMLNQKIIPIDAVAAIWKMLDFRGTGLVIGGTGAGKSSFLNTLFPLLHRSSKIMSIEDAAELSIPQFDWTPLMIDVPITSPEYTEKFEELLNAILRHRPKMIAVGEVRGRSAKHLFDVMSTGHSSLSSFHATTAGGAVNRITSEIGVHPASFAHLWFVLTMAVVITAEKKYLRRCIAFDEVYYDGTKIRLINLCRYNAATDSFEGGDIAHIVSHSKKLEHVSSLDASDDLVSDLNSRKSLLQECIAQNAIIPKKAMEILSRYYAKR